MSSLTVVVESLAPASLRRSTSPDGQGVTPSGAAFRTVKVLGLALCTGLGIQRASTSEPAGPETAAQGFLGASERRPGT